MNINLIVALDSKNGFAKDGRIPWINECFAKEDLKHFRDLTMGHTCIMGRNTYEDISKFTKKIDVLPGRECIVLSKNLEYYISHDTLVYDSLEHAIGTSNPNKDIFIIGGGSIFREAMKWNLNSVYVTKINKDYKCDSFFPYDKLNGKYDIVSSWVSKQYPEVKYNKYKNND